MLYASGKYYVPAPVFEGMPLQKTFAEGLRLGNSVGTWNEVGTFDESTRKVIMLSGTVFATDGVHLVVNADGSMRVRIVDGRIEEWHGNSVLSGRDLRLQVEYIDQ